MPKATVPSQLRSQEAAYTEKATTLPAKEPEGSGNDTIDARRFLLEEQPGSGIFKLYTGTEMLANPSIEADMRIIRVHSDRKVVDLMAAAHAETKFVATFDGLVTQGAKPLSEIIRHVLDRGDPTLWDGIVIGSAMEPKPLREWLGAPPPPPAAREAEFARLAQGVFTSPPGGGGVDMRREPIHPPHGLFAPRGGGKHGRDGDTPADARKSLRPDDIWFYTADGSPQSFMALFYPTGHYQGGLYFKTLGHHFFHAKCMFAGDGDRAARVLGANNRNARDMTFPSGGLNLDNDKWKVVQQGIMNQAVAAKFEDPALRAKLAGTHPCRLLEGPQKPGSLTMLARALMHVRDTIVKERAHAARPAPSK